jgi:hypothetical protein
LRFINVRVFRNSSSAKCLEVSGQLGQTKFDTCEFDGNDISLGGISVDLISLLTTNDSLHNPITFEKAVKDMRNMDLSVMPYENEMETGLKQAVYGKNSIRSASILIGPEGGFSENEVNNAVKNGIITVTLGPRILRTETAGFVCLTILNYALGDMGGRQ